MFLIGEEQQNSLFANSKHALYCGGAPIHFITMSKSFKDLMASYFVLKFCSNKILLNLSGKIFENTIGTPFERLIVPIVKKTFFRRFCAGETPSEVEACLKQLKKSNINGILDYAAEISDKNSDQSLNILESYKQSQISVSICSSVPGTKIALKLSSFFPLKSLEKLSLDICHAQNNFDGAMDYLSSTDITGYLNHLETFFDLCKETKSYVLIDAENLTIQPAVDLIALYLIRKYNNSSPLISNTYQMYMEGAASRLHEHVSLCQQWDVKLGIKLVRGAYLTSDSGKRLGNYGPLFSGINKTHEQYDKTICWLAQEAHKASFPIKSVLLATHNMESINLALKALVPAEKSFQIEFAQLYGLADGMSKMLSQSGYKCYKYLPYGPVSLSIPYLFRRTKENYDILKADEDISEIRKELKKKLLF